MRKKLITFALPCYNEELNVAPAYEALQRVAKKHPAYEFEYVFVDNRSLDRTREEITKLAKKDKHVVGVYLSRNFGPEGSIQAGLDTAHGDAVIVYESDMQDPPEVIHQFIKRWEHGFDAVVGVRTKIEDNMVMTFFRKTFYKIFKSISNIEVPVNAGSFALIDRKVLRAINTLPEKYRFHRGLRAWVGFKTDYVTYERRARTRGKSSYTYLWLFPPCRAKFLRVFLPSTRPYCLLRIYACWHFFVIFPLCLRIFPDIPEIHRRPCFDTIGTFVFWWYSNTGNKHCGKIYSGDRGRNEIKADVCGGGDGE